MLRKLLAFVCLTGFATLTHAARAFFPDANSTSARASDHLEDIEDAALRAAKWNLRSAAYSYAAFADNWREVDPRQASGATEVYDRAMQHWEYWVGKARDIYSRLRAAGFTLDDDEGFVARPYAEAMRARLLENLQRISEAARTYTIENVARARAAFELEVLGKMLPLTPHADFFSLSKARERRVRSSLARLTVWAPKRTEGAEESSDAPRLHFFENGRGGSQQLRVPPPPHQGRLARAGSQLLTPALKHRDGGNEHVDSRFPRAACQGQASAKAGEVTP